MLTLFIRCIIIYFIVLIIFRLMGKRQLGELQPFEFVITLIIADLATIPMAEINIPLLHGIIPLITLTLVQFLISFISCKSITMRKVFNGKPVIIISPNGIDYENLKKLNMNIDDLNEALRNMNYFSFEEIDYAIVETNGKISVLPKSSKGPVTCEDLKIKKEPSYLPLMLVCEGKILNENLKTAHLDKDFVTKILNKQGGYEIKEVIFLTIDNVGKIVLQVKDKSPISFQSSYKGGTW